MYILHSLNLRSLRRRGVAVYGCSPGLVEDSSSINKCVSPIKNYWIIAWLSSLTCYRYPSVDLLWTIIFLFVVFLFVIILSVLRLKSFRLPLWYSASYNKLNNEPLIISLKIPKWVIRSCKSKRDIHYNDQKKKGKITNYHLHSITPNTKHYK